MKILLICAGGMTTGILMKKMSRCWKEKGESFSIRACGLTDYKNQPDDYDIVLAAPQVAYRLHRISDDLHKPAAAIDSKDFATGNCEHIFEQVMDMTKKYSAASSK